MVQPRKLSRDTIVAEAIALLQEGGLEALSLRKLAARLDARAPSLARHVGDKGRLTALMAQAIFLDALDSIPPGLAGDDWLVAFGTALRDKQATTRDISALVASIPPDPEVDAALRERLGAAMAAAGLEGPRAQVEQSAIQAYVTGWMVFETSPRAAMFRARIGQDNAFEDGLAALVTGFASRR